jgi:hypothetical protein
MKHLKLFENIQKKLYICSIVYENELSSNYAFYEEESRNNFLINYIYKDFDNANNDSIKNIFDIDKLVEIFNSDGDTTIYLSEAEILENIKLNPEVEIRLAAKNYNL